VFVGFVAGGAVCLLFLVPISLLTAVASITISHISPLP
jgi:hypothetical protein